RASMPSRIPRLVPTQIIDRRFLNSAAYSKYASSGGGSSDGAFMIAGVESTTEPSGKARNALITFVASDVLRFMYGASVAALAAVTAIIAPLGRTVNRLR